MFVEAIASAALAWGAGAPAESVGPATERAFRKSKYGSVDRIPKFQVTVYPAYPPWKAKLRLKVRYVSR